MSFALSWKLFKSYLLAYLISSLVFSLIVFIRLTFALNTMLLNVVLYDVYYYVMPSIAIFFLLDLFGKSKPKEARKWQRFSLIVVPIVFVIAFSYLLFVVDSCFSIPFSNVIFPLILLPVTHLYFRSKVSGEEKPSRWMMFAILVIILLTPYVLAFSGFNLAISAIGTATNEGERAKLASEYVRVITTSFWGLGGIEGGYISAHRALRGSYLDFQKFLMAGVGSCGEMARATKVFLDSLGVDSRLVGFVGEDHMFVEVKLNGSWFVLDPGYQLNLMTREERGSKRLSEIGGLSYVVAYTEHGLVELTQEYVKTDKIVIRVTNDGEPVANAKITLAHIFMGNMIWLPEFYSNTNGILELKIGPLSYNNSAIEPAEPYYWIYVNGQNTGFRVDSAGSGKVTYIEIELTSIVR